MFSLSTTAHLCTTKLQTELGAERLGDSRLGKSTAAAKATLWLCHRLRHRRFRHRSRAAISSTVAASASACCSRWPATACGRLAFAPSAPRCSRHRCQCTISAFHVRRRLRRRRHRHPPSLPPPIAVYASPRHREKGRAPSARSEESGALGIGTGHTLLGCLYAAAAIKQAGQVHRIKVKTELRGELVAARRVSLDETFPTVCESYKMLIISLI